MRTLIAVIVAAAAATAPSSALAAPSAQAPILVTTSKGPTQLRHATVLSAKGKVLRRFELRCVPGTESRAGDGWTLVCSVMTDPGADGTPLYDLITVDLHTGTAHTVFSSTPARFMQQDTASPSPDGAQLTVGIMERDPSSTAAAKSYVAVIDARTGAVTAVRREVGCDVDPCGSRDGYAYQAPSAGGIWTGEQDHLLVSSGRRYTYSLLDLQTGATSGVPLPVPQPSRVGALLGGRSKKAPSPIYDFGGSVVERVPLSFGTAGRFTWSPDNRYVGVFGTTKPQMYDRKRDKLLDEPIGQWSPDAKRHAILHGRRLELRTLSGRRVRTLFRVPRKIQLRNVVVQWMGAGSATADG